jgi:hypothetical protein
MITILFHINHIVIEWLLVKDLILMSQNMSYILGEVEYFAQYILHIKIMIIWYILLGSFDI